MCFKYVMLICVAAKNVAADIAIKLCESVATKLEGRVLGTFGSEFRSFLPCHIVKYVEGLLLAHINEEF